MGLGREGGDAIGIKLPRIDLKHSHKCSMTIWNMKARVPPTPAAPSPPSMQRMGWEARYQGDDGKHFVAGPLVIIKKYLRIHQKRRSKTNKNFQPKRSFARDRSCRFSAGLGFHILPLHTLHHLSGWHFPLWGWSAGRTEERGRDHFLFFLGSLLMLDGMVLLKQKKAMVRSIGSERRALEAFRLTAESRSRMSFEYFKASN